ncbi:Site-specific recombinase XerD [Ruminococcaceae bacterium FB2012]|nr:Site-specific recombinase XerD [Ruminococcaceae bacterium FB2012]
MATIKKRGDSYLIRVSCGYDVNGKHMEQSMTWKPEAGMSEKQIKKELNRQAVMFEEAVNHGYKTSAMKFQELAEEWFENYAKPNLRSTTYERMLQLTNRVYPAIGHLRIDKITARHLQGFVNSLAKEGANEKTGKPLAPKTIRHNLSFISDVFSYAVRMDLVADNPCRRVTIPKGEVKEKSIYSQEEIAQLLTAINGEPTKYRAFFFLIAYSGFRRSEMLGLEWKDIDFENEIISVKRTSNYTSERGIYTDTTKTKRSKRVLKISPYIMTILRELKDEQYKEANRLGSKWINTDRLFVKWNGEPMNNQTPYGWLKDFCIKNDMPFYGIHSFRHFAASALISSGLDVVTVSGALGHCSSGTTLNIYSHMFQTAQARVAQAMDGAFSFFPQDNEN